MFLSLEVDDSHVQVMKSRGVALCLLIRRPLIRRHLEVLWMSDAWEARVGDPRGLDVMLQDVTVCQLITDHKRCRDETRWW